MKRILITGGTGFIGKNINFPLEVKISSQDVDLRNWKDTLNLFKKHQPDIVIHCAARHGNFKEMEQNKVEFFRDNQAIDLNVFEASNQVGVTQLIALSSVTAFPFEIETEISESDLHQGEPHPSCYTYGYNKRMLDILCRSYNEQYGVNYTCALLTNMYGPFNDFNLESATVVSNLIHKCYIAKQTNSDFKVYGDGSPVRDFMYVEDLTDIFNILLDKKYNEPVIISTGESISLKKLVTIIVNKFRFTGNVIWGNETSVGQQKKVASNKKLLQVSDSISFTSLEDGISKTIDWFMTTKK